MITLASPLVQRKGHVDTFVNEILGKVAASEYTHTARKHKMLKFCC